MNLIIFIQTVRDESPNNGLLCTIEVWCNNRMAQFQKVYCRVIFISCPNHFDL